MVIDFLVLVALLLMSWLGYRKGFTGQIVTFVAIIAVYFLASPAASLVRNIVFDREGITFPGVETASLVLAGVVVFVAAWFGAKLVFGSLTSLSERLESIDQVLGGVFGFVKGLLLAYIVLCVMVYAESPLANSSAALGGQLKQSFTISGARYFNIITHIRYPELSNLREAMAVAEEDPAKAERNESFKKLLANEDFQSVMKDEALLTAAKDRDYSTLLSDERVLRLLADEDFRTVLADTDWDEILDE